MVFKSPKLVCMTPVRNEAWCLDVFLQCTSSWADHIIILDQHSTDGSREIACNYPKVKLIENYSNSYDEADRQKLMIEEARKIEGAKILVALDADDVFSANFKETEDWQQILESQPGDVFGFQWANLLPDKKSFFPSSFYFPWLFNDDGITEHKNHIKWMHSMRIPYPAKSDADYYHIKDFRVLHFSWLNKKRFESKNRFYQCLVTIKEPELNFITIYRSYHASKMDVFPINPTWIQNYNGEQDNFIDHLDLDEKIFWFDTEVLNHFKTYGFEQFRYLNIWDTDWIEKMKTHLVIKDPRSCWIKLIHGYLRISTGYTNAITIRIIDKILKFLF